MTVMTPVQIQLRFMRSRSLSSYHIDFAQRWWLSEDMHGHLEEHERAFVC